MKIFNMILKNWLLLMIIVIFISLTLSVIFIKPTSQTKVSNNDRITTVKTKEETVEEIEMEDIEPIKKPNKLEIVSNDNHTNAVLENDKDIKQVVKQVKKSNREIVLENTLPPNAYADEDFGEHIIQCLTKYLDKNPQVIDSPDLNNHINGVANFLRTSSDSNIKSLGIGCGAYTPAH